jgi:hypothetical protein
MDGVEKGLRNLGVGNRKTKAKSRMAGESFQSRSMPTKGCSANNNNKNKNNNNNNNNSIQFFIIYVPSQQPQGQLVTEHSVDTGKSIIT